MMYLSEYLRICIYMSVYLCIHVSKCLCANVQGACVDADVDVCEQARDVKNIGSNSFLKTEGECLNVYLKRQRV
jgi:hypothetical protein